MTKSAAAGAAKGEPIRVVLSDANVLYSRVLRDYLLYAADLEVISVAWSGHILAETTKHLRANVASFSDESATRLVKAMNSAFPFAQVQITEDAVRQVADVRLPDEDDRHVLAAAVAAEATVLCTSNLKDFPADAVSPFGLSVEHPDELLWVLALEHPQEMIEVHRTAVSRLRGATDASTISALRRAGAVMTADRMSLLLGVDVADPDDEGAGTIGSLR